MFDDQMRWFGRDHLQRILWWHLDTVASFSTVGKQNCHIWDLRSNLKGRTFPETTSSHLKRGAAFSACFLDISPRRLMGWGDSDSWFWTTVFQDLSLFGSSKWFFKSPYDFEEGNLCQKIHDLSTMSPCDHLCNSRLGRLILEHHVAIQ